MPSETHSDWEGAISSFLIHRSAVRGPRTARYYKTQITGLMNWAIDEGIEFPSFLDRHLDEYLVKRIADGRKETTRHHDELVAKVFFKWCRANRFLKRDPLKDRKVRNPAEPFKKTMTEDEKTALIRAIPLYYDVAHNPRIKYHPAGRRANHRDRNVAIISLLFGTACRIGEILSLKVEDYQPGERQIHITESKSRKPRSIPVSDKAAKAVAEWMRVRRAILKDVPEDERPDWLFINELLEKVDEGKFNRTFHRITAFVGISKQLNLHSMRRYTLNKYSLVDLAGAQKLAGHSDPKTTMIYVNVTAERMRDLTEKVDILGDAAPAEARKKRRAFGFTQGK